jgi:hypothetical protein
MTPHEGLRIDYLAPPTRRAALPQNAAGTGLYPGARRIRLVA